MNTVANIVQILFWIIVGTVTVLTFKQARKTVLQPLRTEVFKLQLEQMREVMSMFVGRQEVKLYEDAHLEAAFQANAMHLVHNYAETFFPIKIDRKKALYADMHNVQAKETAFSLADEHVAPPPRTDEEKELARVRRREEWPGDPAEVIILPDGLVDYKKRMQSMLENPLLPSECAKLIEEYLTTIYENIGIIGDVLTWAAVQLPERYPDLDTLQQASPGWMHAYWIRQSKPLEPHAVKITAFARTYFKSDEFAPNSERRRLLLRRRQSPSTFDG